MSTGDRTPFEGRELPATVELALDRYGSVERARVRNMFNRHRAVFAEFLVEQLLPGSEVVHDPNSSWDLTWSVDGQVNRIQVKCSGSYLPRMQRLGTKALWKLDPPKKGWDSVLRIVLPAGHHCDIIVLARHDSDRIDAGWTFVAIAPSELPSATRVTPAMLPRSLVPPDQLEAQARAVISQQVSNR